MKLQVKTNLVFLYYYLPYTNELTLPAVEGFRTLLYFSVNENLNFKLLQFFYI